MKWNDINKGNPKKDGEYIVCIETGEPKTQVFALGIYDTLRLQWFFIPSCYVNFITHWMPLPKAPTQKKMSKKK